MDWKVCVICSKGGGELKCPADSLNKNGLEIYRNFLKQVEEFCKIDALPVDVNFKDEGTAETFLKNRAKWHKACQIKFATSKLVRAQEQALKKRKHELATDEARKSKRRASGTPPPDGCIFCSQISGKLHQCSTMRLDHDLRKMATDLQDTNLLARISGGDLVAIEAKYHHQCLCTFRNRHRAMQRESCSSSSNRPEKLMEARAFAELISYIEYTVEDGTFIFKLSEIHTLYEERLHHLGISKKVNKTRLKMQLLDHFAGDCQEQSDGKNILLVFNEGLKKLLKEAVELRDFTAEALSMAKLVKVIRQEMFDWASFKFTGSFPKDCQSQSVPPSLKYLVSMLLNGSNVTDQDATESQACLTVSQLIFFNARNKPTSMVTARHSKSREAPLPIYIGLSIHTLTRSKKIVNNLHKLGSSISYGRVIELENMMACAVCDHFKDEGLVCPANLKKGLFTVGALDNIDHNPSSTTAQGSFHGTGISIFQFPTASNNGESRDPIVIQPQSNQTKFSLPESYTTVPAVSAATSQLSVPATTMADQADHLEEAKNEEDAWIARGIQLLSQDELQKGDYITWAAFHASLESVPEDPPAITALLPLFQDKAATLAMVKHGMDIQRKVTNHLNPGQTPVIAFDQPLFALGKFVQWCWPQTHGEKEYLVMFGGLHIEMALWTTIGQFLDGSGWTTALCDAGVATSGTADSFLKASHLTRTRHSHQVTAMTLARLQREAWQLMGDSNDEGSFTIWRGEMIKKSPTFHYWNIILDFEVLVLIFIRAHRSRNLSVYLQSLEALVPWFFALDRSNYARWIPIHIRDLKSLPENIKEEFQKFWVIPKTQNKFSSMPIDQAHEQNNELVKGSGGAIGLTENPTAFKRWMVAGPEQARLIQEFESQYLHDVGPSSFQQHEQGPARQESFRQQVSSLYTTITSMGNPFIDDCPELLVLSTRNCASENVVTTVRNIEATGVSQYQKYVKDVIVDRSASIHQPIPRNSLPLFKHPHSKPVTKTKQQLSSLKSDCNLFSQLYIASTFRDGDLDEFFSYENQPWPPSLSQHGKLRLPTSKSDMLGLLDKRPLLEPPENFDAKIYDGAAIVHALPTNQASTFGDYADMVFLPWAKKQLQNAQRIDIVWDVYQADSLKEATREKRGKGIRLKVGARTKLPPKFADFLRDPINKEEIFQLLTQRVSASEYPPEKEVYVTSGKCSSVSFDALYSLKVD